MRWNSPHVVRRHGIAISLLALVSSASLGGASPDVGIAQDAAKIELTKLREIRELTVKKREEDGRMMMSMSDQPGLQLTFSISILEGGTLIELAQPETVKATDSTGRDISAIEPGFMGEVEYVDVPMSFNNEPPKEFSVQLAMPDRAAKTFSLAAVVIATVHDDIETIEFTVGKEWITLGKDQLDGNELRVRYKDGEGLEVENTELAQRLIETIELTSGDTTVETNGYMSFGRTITYTVDGRLGESVTAKLHIRAGLREVPIRIELKNQKLP